MPNLQKSKLAFADASHVMPGGVSSPVRAFKAVGGTPPFIASASGCRITDIDGNTYIDYVASYGPLIAGHAHPAVVSAISAAAAKGTSFGTPTEAETRLARTILAALPGHDKIRFVNSGTEAAMSALRLARAATQRDLVVKCAGCYHGHFDALLVEAGSGALTLGNPTSGGVPEALAKTTVVVPYNDLDATARVFDQIGSKIACFAVEPIAGNMGCVLPRPGYLAGLRELCDKHGALLLMDEVMTGFRVHWGGAQILHDVRPDITCLGKIIGGGLPCAAYAARAQLMDLIAPLGPVYQAGTLSGNPLAMAAGAANLGILAQPGAYGQLERNSARIADGIAIAAQRAGVPLAINRQGAMIGLFFTHHPGDVVQTYAQATACNTQRFATFFHAMLDRGVYLPPSMFEAWFPGLAHDDAAIRQTLEAADDAFQLIKAKA